MGQREATPPYLKIVFGKVMKILDAHKENSKVDDNLLMNSTP